MGSPPPPPSISLSNWSHNYETKLQNGVLTKYHVDAIHLLSSQQFYRSLQLTKSTNEQRYTINLLKPTGYVTHQQFKIQQLYVLPTLYLCVL